MRDAWRHSTAFLFPLLYAAVSRTSTEDRRWHRAESVSWRGHGITALPSWSCLNTDHAETNARIYKMSTALPTNEEVGLTPFWDGHNLRLMVAQVLLSAPSSLGGCGGSLLRSHPRRNAAAPALPKFPAGAGASEGGRSGLPPRPRRSAPPLSAAGVPTFVSVSFLTRALWSSVRYLSQMNAAAVRWTKVLFYYLLCLR